MDLSQIVVTTLVGAAASVVTALVTSALTRSQERRKYEREVAAKLADLGSTEPAHTMLMAMQHGHSCIIVERQDQAERDRVFLPVGSRITLGRAASNHIRLDHPFVSSMHAAFRAQGDHVFLEPLAPTNGMQVNGQVVTERQRLAAGDVVTLPDTPFKMTFVRLVS